MCVTPFLATFFILLGGHIVGLLGAWGLGCLLPTLECLDLVGRQVPGLVNVAEQLVVVGLWVREELCRSPAPRIPTCLLLAPCPQITGSLGPLPSQHALRSVLTVEDAVDEGQGRWLDVLWGWPPGAPDGFFQVPG